MNPLLLTAFLLAAPPAEPYQSAKDKAQANGNWLVTYIGCPVLVRPDTAITAYCDELEGFPPGTVAISGPYKGRHVWYATVENPSEKAINAALAQARKEEATVKVAPFREPSNNAERDRNGNGPVGTVDALEEVNRQRAERGLRPYLRDEGLMDAACRCSAYRAANRISGHTDDFAFVPSGTSATCAGCAAWASGFGACAIFDNYTYCGAAYTVGSDGLKYCHCFYR